MQPILVANALGKKYYRNPNRHMRYGLSDLLREIARQPVRQVVRKDEFWAVRDVSFSLNPGESLGVIGRNGGGKTTLLKMLTGLIRADEGSITVSGNVQALINLGAGFNDSLPGRENIVNAAALRGLNPGETRERIDEIIAFAELGDFIDSPVGIYSSGMKGRLGFSVCAHLDPTVVIIDEALSVGDQTFQNKCLIRLEQMKRRGVGMVLVSHSMTHIQQFCETAIWLEKGEVKTTGDVRDVIQRYLVFVEGANAPSPVKAAVKTQVSAPGESPNPVDTGAALPVPAGSQGLGPAAASADAKAAAEEGKAPAESTEPGPPISQPGEPAAPRQTENLEAPRLEAAKAAQADAKAEPEHKSKIPPEDVSSLYGVYFDTGKVDNIQVRLLVNGQEVDQLEMNQGCVLEYSFDLRERVTDLNVSLVFYRKNGLHVTTISTLNGDLLSPHQEGHIRCRVTIPDLGFAAGDYVLAMPIHMGRSCLYRDVVKEFKVLSGPRMCWGVMNLGYDYDVLI